MVGNMTESGFAYAKINISLDIISKMPDGFHSMRMVMQTVSLCDEITIECTPGEGVRISDPGRPFLPSDGRNIAAKAARVFLAHSGITGYKISIQIKKHIPVCAGLGGGSADGACVLRMLDKMFATGLEREELIQLGSNIGSDVPYCVFGGTKLAEGRGEVLTDLPPLPPCHIVICKPRFSFSTPELFRQINCKRIRSRPDTDGIIKSIENNDLEGIARRMYNVFEDALPRGKHEIEGIKYSLLDNGALGAVMSGSGPAVFGVFNDKSNAQKAYESLKQEYKECFMAESVNTMRYGIDAY